MLTIAEIKQHIFEDWTKLGTKRKEKNIIKFCYAHCLFQNIQKEHPEHAREIIDTLYVNQFLLFFSNFFKGYPKDNLLDLLKQKLFQSTHPTYTFTKQSIQQDYEVCKIAGLTIKKIKPEANDKITENKKYNLLDLWWKSLLPNHINNPLFGKSCLELKRISFYIGFTHINDHTKEFTEVVKEVDFGKQLTERILTIKLHLVKCDICQHKINFFTPYYQKDKDFSETIKIAAKTIRELPLEKVGKKYQFDIVFKKFI